MENYYKILEVDVDASEETIEKVYKLLVKKYHPDLKSINEKNDAENKIKKINEAYSVLSDKFKRAEYDQIFNTHYVSIEAYNSVINENNELKKNLNDLKHQFNYSQNNYNNFQYNSNNSQNRNYKTQYTNYTENPRKTYTTKQQTSSERSNEKNNILITFISLFLTFLIIFLVLQIPFIKNIFSVFKFENIIFLIIIIIAFFYFFYNKH